MKRYYNETTKEWFYEGKSITKYVKNGVFSGIPSENQLTEWGFVEYIEPTPTAEELLAQAKANKVAELEAYDYSDAVNGFLVNNTTAWIDAETRSQYKTSIEAAELLGEESITFAINDAAMTLPIANAKLMLAQIQRYADACYLVTMTHKAAINALESVEDVEGYDFTTGYPSKLIFNV